LNRARVSESHLSKSPSPVSLFISYAKQDGLGIAEKIKEYILRETPLKTFFDATDIAPGQAVGKEIEANIETSCLLAIQSDKYSSREWCRREVIMAKKYGCPMLVVNAVTDGEERSFPYLGNVPTVRWRCQSGDSPNKNIRQILDTMLYEVLKIEYFRHYLEYLSELFAIPDVIMKISRPPELMTLTQIQREIWFFPKRDAVILYPDPPLGDEERDLLHKFAPDLNFTTPILFWR
jgi:hypothetical protein